MCNVRKYSLFLLMLFFFRASPFSFDGRVTPSVVDYRPTLTNGDYVWGAVFFDKGIEIAANATVVISSLAVPIREKIYMGRLSKINMFGDLDVMDGIEMGTDSAIYMYGVSASIGPTLNIFNGTITATNRGHIYQGTYTQRIRTQGHNLGDSTIIVHNGMQYVEWDFSNGPIICGSSRGGDYESEYGIFFKNALGGSVYLLNGDFSTLWQNASGVPELRFYGIGVLGLIDIKLGFFSDTTYTFSGMNFFYPHNVTFGAVPWRVCDFYGPSMFGSFTIPKGVAVNFKNAVGLAAGPIYFDGCSLTFTDTAFLRYPAFIIENVVSMDCTTDKKPLDVTAAHFLISPGAGINFINGNIAF